MNCWGRTKMGRKLLLFAAAVSCVVASDSHALSQPPRYFSRVQVKEVTRLDWLFPFLHTSPSDVPPDIDERFHLARSNYEYFGPRRTSTSIPLVVFVSPSNEPTGWDSWRPICQKHGIAFVGVRNAGNGVAVDVRIRLVLEALGDVRRRIRVDPDRTYISGFSGGAQVASLVGFNLPEYFGGVICLGSQPIFPTEPCCLSRVAERVSVATIYGAKEPFAPVAKLVSQPEFKAASVRYASHIQKGQGHVMPPSRVLEQAFLWLEKDIDRRLKVAKRFPATRISDEPTRSEWASRVLEDAKLRLEDESTVNGGIEQLSMLVQRWDDVPATKEANELLRSHKEAADSQPRLQERDRQILKARATGFGELALKTKLKLPGTQRIEFAKMSLSMIRQSEEMDAVFSEHQLEQLREISARKSRASKLLIPLDTAVFELAGEMSRWESLNAFAKTLGRLGYDVEMDTAVLEREAEWRAQVHEFGLHAASFKSLSRQVLDPLELQLKTSGRKVRIYGKAPKKR